MEKDAQEIIKWFFWEAWQVEIACWNGPKDFVISGKKCNIEKCIEDLR